MAGSSRRRSRPDSRSTARPREEVGDGGELGGVGGVHRGDDRAVGVQVDAEVSGETGPRGE